MPAPDRRSCPNRRQLIIELLLVLLLVGLPIFLLYGHGDVENDEAIYSFAAEKMVETGEWLTPVGIYHGNPPFLEKPPLKFWLAAFGLEMGLPHNNWGLRFADVVLTVLIFGYLVAIAIRVGGRWAGLWSGLVFFAFADPIVQHGLLANNTESAVVLQYVGGMYHFMAWAGGARRKALHAMAIGLLFVLGFMSKFVAALFLPVILAVVLLIHRDLLRRFWTDIGLWLAVGVLAVVLIAPWFVYQHLQMGQVFWNIIFGEHVVQRMTRFLDPTHLLPWYFYILSTVRMVIESGAGLAYLIGFWFVVKVYPAKRDPGITTLFVWYFVPVIAISAMTSKVTHYMYPFLPPVAVVCGFGLAQLLQLNLAAAGEYRYGRWLSRISAGLAAVPLQRLAFAAAAAPIVVMYGFAVHDLRFRSSSFLELEACLQDLGAGAAVQAFFQPNREANHVFTYHDLAAYGDTDSELLNRLLFGDRPEPVWLPVSKYRALASSEERIRSVEAQWIPLAEIRTGEGDLEAVFLLLPGEFAACGARVQNAGSKPVDPMRHAE